MASANNREAAEDPDGGEAVDLRVSYVLGRLDRALRQRLDAALHQLGITTPQFTALSVLRNREDLSNAQLARRSLITPQSMFTVLKALERKGLIERTPAPNHGRVRYTRLTGRGKQLMDLCDVAVDEVERDLLGDFSAAEGTMLMSLARRGVRNLHAGLAEREETDQYQTD